MNYHENQKCIIQLQQITQLISRLIGSIDRLRAGMYQIQFQPLVFHFAGCAQASTRDHSHAPTSSTSQTPKIALLCNVRRVDGMFPPTKRHFQRSGKLQMLASVLFNSLIPSNRVEDAFTGLHPQGWIHQNVQNVPAEDIFIHSPFEINI